MAHLAENLGKNAGHALGCAFEMPEIGQVAVRHGVHQVLPMNMSSIAGKRMDDPESTMRSFHPFGMKIKALRDHFKVNVLDNAVGRIDAQVLALSPLTVFLAARRA